MWSYVFFLIVSLSTVTADYQCLCNYNVELKVYEKPSTTSSGVDYMYEFDCKQYLPITSLTKPWMAIAVSHSVRYVSGNSAVQIQMCQGSPPLEDRVTTTPQPATTTTTSTTTTAATTTTPQTTSTTTTTTTTKPTTTTTKPTTTTTKPTTTTTKPTTTTTKPTTSTTKPTTTTTKPTPTTTKSTPTTTQPTTTTTKSTTKTTKPTTTTTKPTNTTTQPTTTTTKPTTTTTQPTTTTTKPTTTTTKPTTTTTKPTTTTTKPTTTTTKPTTTTTKPTTTTTKLTTTTSLTTSAAQTTPINALHNPCAYVQAHHSSQLRGNLASFWHICYEFVTKAVTWGAAEHNCQSKGGNLAHIESSGEQAFIFQYLQANLSHRVWIGLNDRHKEEKFEWSSGDPLDFTFWSPSRYSSLHDVENCVELDPKNFGFWDDIDCDSGAQTRYGYVCQYDYSVKVPITHVTNSPTHLPTTSTQRPHGFGADGNTHLCPSKQIQHSRYLGTVLGQYGGHCYELMPVQSVSWLHAENLCATGGGHLVDINNSAEQVFIQNFVHRHMPQKAVWLGLHDRSTEGVYQWTTGLQVHYKHFIRHHIGNFANRNVENCVVLIPYKNGKWDDIPCGQNDQYGDYGETHPVLCQFPTTSTHLIG